MADYNKEKFESIYRKCKIGGTSVLGEGGNAIVFRVQHVETGDTCALKFLQVLSKEKMGRFCEEVNIMRQSAGYGLVMPILDANLDEFWYTMPLAEGVINFIKTTKQPPMKTMEMFIMLTGTFVVLSSHGIAHRDIKPGNIYYYNKTFYIGDFGLVDFPDNPNDFTTSDRGLGAIFTIAPEMKRDPSRADGLKADVYSLAKTMWMLLTLDEKGFDGQYEIMNPYHALHKYDRLSDIHLVELEELLVAATSDDPDKRPSMMQFMQFLIKWHEIANDEYKAELSNWRFIRNLLFKGITPDSLVWKDKQEILNILHQIANIPASNHTMFSKGGGLDLMEVQDCAEEGCICMQFGRNDYYIVKPKSLHYEVFKGNERWNYFLLELDQLKPSVYEYDDEEVVVEDHPGHYIKSDTFQYGVYDYDTGEPLPQRARLVSRLLKGCILIVMKFGPYNHIQNTYDGRHSLVRPDEFRTYIEHLIDVYQNKTSTPEDYRKAISELQRDWDEPKEDHRNLAPYDYVEKNYKSWNFADCLPQSSLTSDKKLRYSLEVRGLDEHAYSFLEEPYTIMADGTIGKSSNGNGVFYCYNRDEIILAYRNINSKVLAYAHGYDGLSSFGNLGLSPTIYRIGKPSHLFTLEELEDVMRKADDRVNNCLVIDENGYFQMIQDTKQGVLYPVRHEIFCAGRNYVGRYSPLYGLKQTYESSLILWLSYLRNDNHQYCDYDESCDEKLVISKIIELTK